MLAGRPGRRSVEVKTADGTGTAGGTEWGTVEAESAVGSESRLTVVEVATSDGTKKWLTVVVERADSRLAVEVGESDGTESRLTVEVVSSNGTEKRETVEVGS